MHSSIRTRSVALALVAVAAVALTGASSAQAGTKVSKSAQIPVRITVAAYAVPACNTSEIAVALRRNRPVALRVSNLKASKPMVAKIAAIGAAAKRNIPAVRKIFAANPLFAKPIMRLTKKPKLVRSSVVPAIAIFWGAGAAYEAAQGAAAATAVVLTCAAAWGTYGDDVQQGWMEVLKWLHRRRQEGDTTVTEEDILEAARKAGLGDGTTDTGDCGGEGQGEGQDNNGATDIEGGNTDTNGAGTDPNKGGNTDPNAGAGGQGGTGEGGTGMNRTDSDASHSGSESGCSFHAGF